MSKETSAESRRKLLQGMAALTALGAVSGAGAQVSPETPTQSQAAMDELTATLVSISNDYFSAERAITSVADIAAGQRLLMHLLSAATDFYLEGDPARPWFANMVSPTRKFLGDNPDARYYFTQIYGDRSYRIRGRRLGREYISFTVHGGERNGNWNSPGTAHVNHRNIRFDLDGNYEIIVGPEKRGRSWLRTNPDSVYIVNRNYYEHRENAAADISIIPEVSIEPVDEPAPPKHLDDAETATRIRAVGNFIKASTINIPPQTPKTTPGWFSLQPNSVGAPFRFGDDQGDTGFGAIDNAYSAGFYILQPGQALLMEGELPRCYFANVVLWNRYMQCGDYVNHQISLNRKQLKLRNNDEYRIVITPENPGINNWLDTEGQLSGIVFWRFLLSEGKIATPQCRVIELAQARQLAD